MSNDEKLKLEDFQRAAKAVESVEELMLYVKQQARTEVIEELRQILIEANPYNLVELIEILTKLSEGSK